MKKFILAIIATFLPTSILCFCLGRNYEEKYYGSKYYKDACHMSDLIRFYSDDIDKPSKSHIKASFEDLKDFYLKEHKVNLSDYVWEY